MSLVVGQAEGGGGSSPWVTKTADYTAVAGDRILADTLTVDAWTLTLPASPSVGDEVEVLDAPRHFATASLTIARNSSPIESATDDLVCNVSGVRILLVYGNATVGWRVILTL